MKFKTAVVDPPWGYSNKNTGGSTKYGMVSGAASHYTTLTLDEIVNLNIKSIMEEDSMCYLWCTSPLLEYGLKALLAWGFHYKFTIYWVKPFRIAMGFWLRNNVEICLVGKRGKVKPFRSASPNVVFEMPRKHSQKPKAFWDLIEPLAESPRAELFAREKRDGWMVWGDEVDSDFDGSIILKSI